MLQQGMVDFGMGPLWAGVWVSNDESYAEKAAVLDDLGYINVGHGGENLWVHQSCPNIMRAIIEEIDYALTTIGYADTHGGQLDLQGLPCKAVTNTNTVVILLV